MGRPGLCLFGLMIGADLGAKVQASPPPAYPNCVWLAIGKVNSGRFVLRVIYTNGVHGPVTYQVERGGQIQQVVKIVNGECEVLPITHKERCQSHTDVSGKGVGKCL